ncbi:MAG TPA: hypothetical protein VM925_37900 [Labilithrix sp.]|jgi:hypothetical protein|nr:hypothetical protein [Labilithrix sp.]
MNIDEQSKEPSRENVDEPRPRGWDAAEQGADDHVEVLVEDLFIEEYQAPLALPSDRELREASRLGTAGPIRSRAKSLLGGLLALGGLAFATLFLSGRRRKVSALSRLFLKLGIAR